MSTESMMLSNQLILCCPLSSSFQSFPALEFVPVSWLFFASGGQNIEASTSVFSMNIQGWFLLWLTGFISLWSKECSRVFLPAPQRESRNSLALGLLLELPRWLSGKESTCQFGRLRTHRYGPCIWRIPWRRKWQPTPVFLAEKFHGQRSLAGSTPWDHRVRHD